MTDNRLILRLDDLRAAPTKFNGQENPSSVAERELRALS